MNWIKKFITLLKPDSPVYAPVEPDPGSDARADTRSASEKRMTRLMRAVVETREIELSCDEVLLFFDQYAEAIERGEDPEQWMPTVKHHLDMCAECAEELQTVIEILRSLPRELKS